MAGMTLMQLLRRDGRVICPVKGTSMLPLLDQEKDKVVLEPITQEPKIGDVPLFRRRKGRWVLHRINATDGNSYLIRGDNRYGSERIPRKKLVAVMTGFFKNGVYVSCDDPDYRAYVEKVLAAGVPLVSEEWRYLAAALRGALCEGTVPPAPEGLHRKRFSDLAYQSGVLAILYPFLDSETRAVCREVAPLGETPEEILLSLRNAVCPEGRREGEDAATYTAFLTGFAKSFSMGDNRILSFAKRYAFCASFGEKEREMFENAKKSSQSERISAAFDEIDAIGNALFQHGNLTDNEYHRLFGQAGSDAEYIASETIRRYGKKRYILHRLFPGLSQMRRRYPILKKLPILLPFCWAARLFARLFRANGLPVADEIQAYRRFLEDGDEPRK